MTGGAVLSMSQSPHTSPSIPADYGLRLQQHLSPTRGVGGSFGSSSTTKKPTEPTRLELLARCRRGKEFAGEIADPPADTVAGTFKVTSGVIGYFGHLPGIESSFGTSYPNQIKKATKFIEEREATFGKSVPKVDGDGLHDKWGNLKERPDQLKRDVGNLYLQVAHPGIEIDTTKGIGVIKSDTSSLSPLRSNTSVSPLEATFFKGIVDQKKAAEKNHNSPGRSQALLRKSAAVPDPLSVSNEAGLRSVPLMIRPAQPQHIVGYKGFQPGAREVYGEPYNRLETRLQTVKAQNAQAMRYGPTRGVSGNVTGTVGNSATGMICESESQRLLGSYEQHNLIVANRNAVSH